MLFPSLLAALLAPAALSGTPGVSPHAFQPPRANWIKKVDYLKDYVDREGHTEGYTVVHPQGSLPSLKRYHREVSFFRSQADQKAGEFCKILRYNPKGYLEEDFEDTGTDRFARSLNADGSVCSCTHFRVKYGDKAVYQALDGYSVSPVRKTVSRFSNGNGNLIVWDRDEQAYQRTWYYEGAAYLEQKRVHGQVWEQRLSLQSNGDFWWRPRQETLFFEDEAWTKEKGKPLSAQVMDSYSDAKTGQMIKENVPDDPIKQRIRQLWFFGWWSPPARERERMRKELLAQLEKDYATRRAAFMAAYGERLTQAGQSWQSLGLEDIREGH